MSSRTLKRVPLDFEWALNQVWKGYICPYRAIDCKPCGGTGLNPETRKLSDDWYGFKNPKYINLPDGRRYNDNAWSNHITQDEVQALIDAGRLMDFTRVPINEKQKKIVEEKIKNGGNSWLPFDNGYIPTAEEVNKWNREGMGHDGLNQSICLETRAKRLGVYGRCKYCQGDGEIWQSEEIQKLAENWEAFEPPKGDGYQLWETCSEGSPVSPVFKTLEELCVWAEVNATTFAHFKATKEEWEKMLSDDFVYHQEGKAIFM